MSRSSKRTIRAIKIRSVNDKDVRSMFVETRITNGKKIIETKALIDSGAQGIFMDEQFAKKHKLPLLRLENEIQVSNVDNTPNRNGPIRHFTRLPTKIDGKLLSTRFLISNLGKEDIILGLPWLNKINPLVDWTKNTEDHPRKDESTKYVNSHSEACSNQTNGHRTRKDELKRDLCRSIAERSE